MKNIILKTPSFVFLILIFIPFIFWYLDLEFKGFLQLLFKTRLIPVIIGTIWISSLSAYMINEFNPKKSAHPIYLLIAIKLLISLWIISIAKNAPMDDSLLWLELINLLLTIGIAIVTTRITKKVFYGRTTWFLFLEIFILPLGMITLTPDVQNWEKGDKL